MDNTEFQKLTYPEKIEAIISEPKSFNLPEEAAIVAQYVAEMRPQLPPKSAITNVSSSDINGALMDICDTTINIVSKVMRLLGYRLYVDEGSPVWSVAPKLDDIDHAHHIEAELLD